MTLSRWGGDGVGGGEHMTVRVGPGSEEGSERLGGCERRSTPAIGI